MNAHQMYEETGKMANDFIPVLISKNTVLTPKHKVAWDSFIFSIRYAFVNQCTLAI